MSRVIVYHDFYGCETGCCGHTVELDNGEGKFEFDHPAHGQDPIEFAKGLVTAVYGAEHVADLDWDNCMISED
jgi:hypothetical protein